MNEQELFPLPLTLAWRSGTALLYFTLRKAVVGTSNKVLFSGNMIFINEFKSIRKEPATA
jgi:hypothetical protein